MLSPLQSMGADNFGHLHLKPRSGREQHSLEGAKVCTAGLWDPSAPWGISGVCAKLGVHIERGKRREVAQPGP